MNQKTNLRVVTLKDLRGIFISKLWALILAAVLGGGGLFLFHHLTFVPQYSSTATLYILRQAENLDKDASSDFSLALKVVNDCTYLLKSHAVLDEVIEDLSLDVSYEDLRQRVSTANPEDTRILEVSVTSDSPEAAKRIVDQICAVGPEKIENAMGFQQVNLYEYGILNPEPCNRTGMVTYILVGGIAALLVYIVFLICFLADARIHTDEDVERYLGLSVLGDIPNADRSTKEHDSYASYGAQKRTTKEQRKG